MELFGVENGIVLRVLHLSFLVQVALSSSVDNSNPFRRYRRSTNCDAKFNHISDHTACISASSSATSAGISANDKTFIVDHHNGYRRDVSPTATNMRTMSWDDEVAMIAQKWAENCQFGHDDSYSRYIPGRFTVGQNIAIGQTSWTNAMDAWHSEVSAFTLGGSNVFSNVGHYTQIVWAETSKLGCGFAICSGSRFYVCNYSPAGNLDYNNPYIAGTSCSACPSSCNSNQCDCAGKVCLNQAAMDVDTCGCTCHKPYLVGSDCALNCTGLTSDPAGCNSGQFITSKCPVYSNLPSDCPLMCQTCPHGDSTGENGASRILFDVILVIGAGILHFLL
ncbi:cysteine-rich venom protein ophanin-like isoform X2 [Pecten maximus]|uniref:cysteine-rich venom protein ophanin-like isoform X2 n=1 Tax=Pecten maximus TaxID=6579 RepID=UPI0014584E29|nr:cysteine-rich venom protein ophanin-like isoform X2 [Pecten maximus]